MPIKAIKLRAGFLLLLFTLMFLSSNFLIIESHAETLEESFKSSPLPFWETETENVLVDYGTNTQNILFSYGEHLEDFNDVSDWIKYIDCEEEDIYFSQNGIGHFQSNYAGGTDYDQYYKNNMNQKGSYFIEITYKTTQLGVRFFLRGHEGTTPAGAYVWSESLTGSYEWTTLKFYKTGDFDVLILRSYLTYSSVNIQIADIHIWKEYQEDMSDVSDWSYDSSATCTLYGFKAINGIGELWTYAGLGSTDHWVIYNTPLNYLVTSKTRLEMKSKVENSEITLSLGISYDVSFSWLLTNDQTTYQTQNYDLSGIKGSTITYVKIKNDDIPDNNAWNRNWTAYFDYIEIWEEGGTLNVSIPIDQFKNQKFEFMIDTDDLTESSEVDFGIFQNDESMNYDFSLKNKIFEQRDFSFNYTEYNYLRFKLELKYSTNYFKLICYDENNSKLFDNVIYDYVRKTGNQFIISSSNFSGWFHLYYFTGNVDYSSFWEEQIIYDSPLIYDTLLTSYALDDDILDSYEKRYTQYVSNFQFLRTNMYMWSEYSYLPDSDYIECKIRTHFYYPNGTIHYLVTGKISRERHFMWFTLRVYQGNEWTVPIFTSFASKTGSNTMEESVEFAIWRTQENYLGTFYNVDDTWTVRTDTPTRFVSNETLQNFQGNVSIMYRVTDLHGSSYRNFIIELDGFELGYSGVDGVSEPHFSSTWWDSIPIIGPIIHAFIIVGNAIAVAIEAGLLPIELLISAVADLIISAIVSAIGGVAGSVWALFESSLDSMGVSIDAIANDIWGLFTGILDTISGVLDDIYSTITDTYTAIVNLSSNLIASIGTGITNALVPAILAGIQAILDEIFNLWEYELNLVGTALGWGTVGTFLFDFTDAVVLTVPSWLEFLINTSVTMVNILVWANLMWSEYGAMFILYGTLFVAIDILGAVMTLDLDKIGDCLSKYVKVIIWIVEFVFNIISTVLNAIWGILPF